MPIVQVRAHQGEQYLSAPISFKDTDPILNEWCQDAWESEMLIYPPNYTGEVTPENWSTHSFMLSVNESGEQGRIMVAGGKLKTAEETAEALEQLRASTDEQTRFSNVSTIDERRPSIFLATAINPSTLAIGGIMMHTTLARLESLRSMFRTTEVA